VLEIFQTTAEEIAELDFGGLLVRLTPSHYLYAEPGGWTAARDNHMQRTVRLKDGRKAGDAGGYLIGSQFGGHGNNSNMVAMMPDGVNAYPNGTWGSMEKTWADALSEGKSVHVEIEPIHRDATARPHSFEIFETINGVKNQCIVNNF
jgi:filamentous hemagglutinin